MCPWTATKQYINVKKLHKIHTRYFISLKCVTNKEPRKDKWFVTFSSQVNVVYTNTTFYILFTTHTYKQFHLEIDTRQTNLLQKRQCTHFIANSQNNITPYVGCLMTVNLMTL